MLAVRSQLEHFGWIFTLLSVSAAVLWLSLTRLLWAGEMRAVAHRLVIVSIIHGVIGWSVVMPVIAKQRSYRDFMAEVNARVKPEDKLYIFGRFNSDPVVFYRGRAIEQLEQPVATMIGKAATGDGYVIMPERALKEIQKATGNLPQALLKSEGRGPENDARLVLVQAEVP